MSVTKARRIFVFFFFFLQIGLTESRHRFLVCDVTRRKPVSVLVACVCFRCMLDLRRLWHYLLFNKCIVLRIGTYVLKINELGDILEI